MFAPHTVIATRDRLCCIILLSTLASGCQANLPMAGNRTGTAAINEETVTMNTGDPARIGLEKDDANGVVRLTAVSHGCTKAEHFSIRVDDQGELVATRLKADRCRRRPHLVVFEFPLNDIAGSSGT